MSNAGTTTRPTTSPTTNALATVRPPNPALPSRATAKIRGCSRMARQISPSPRPSTPVRTGSARSTSGTPYLLAELPCGAQLPVTCVARWTAADIRRYGRSRHGPYTLTPSPGPDGRPVVVRFRHPISSMRRVTDFAPIERAALADLMAELGPDAPTLCEGWTTRDLAAHLVVRATTGRRRRRHRAARSGRAHQTGTGSRCRPALAGAARRRPAAAVVGVSSWMSRSTGTSTSSTTRTYAGRSRAGNRASCRRTSRPALWAGLRTPARLALRRTPAQVTITAPGLGSGRRRARRAAGRPGRATRRAAALCLRSPGTCPGGAGRPARDHGPDAHPPVRALAQTLCHPLVAGNGLLIVRPAFSIIIKMTERRRDRIRTILPIPNRDRCERIHRFT